LSGCFERTYADASSCVSVRIVPDWCGVAGAGRLQASLAVEGSGRLHLSVRVGRQVVRDGRACGVGGAAGLAGARCSRHGSSPGVSGLTAGAPRREDHRARPEAHAGQGRRLRQGGLRRLPQQRQERLRGVHAFITPRPGEDLRLGRQRGAPAGPAHQPGLGSHRQHREQGRGQLQRPLPQAG